MGDLPVQFLLDTGAAVSVVRYDTLGESLQQQINPVQVATFGANGSPLDVVGQVKTTIKIGELEYDQLFTVVKQLSVAGILGADFLVQHSALIDCKNNSLLLADQQVTVPIKTIGSSLAKPTVSNVVALTTQEIPGRSSKVIQCWLKNSDVLSTEGLVEPLQPGTLPKNILVGRSLNAVEQQQRLTIPVVNVGPSPVKIYKGTRVALFTPRHEVFLVDQDDVSPQESSLLSQRPDINLESTDLTHDEKAQLQTLLSEFSDVFATPEGLLGRTNVVKHSIHVEGRPIRQPSRRLPEALKPVVNSEVDKMLSQGVIQQSNSPWSSPIVMVQKKDGSWRFCIDYRKVNAHTHRDAYPLPRIDETLDSLSGATYFSTLDLASGYWQVEMAERDKEKTAFSTPYGHYEFNVMPFGLTNAPATFQRLMECVLSGLTLSECLIYLDDIIIFSATFSEHVARLRNVLQRLRNANLKLKPSKCCFAQSSVKYLGHIVSRKGVHADPEKVEAVFNYPSPKDLKELNHFLGLTSYYRRFIEGYAKIAVPLHKLRQKGNNFCWNDNCEKAFIELKSRLMNSPILSYPDFSLPFVLSTDASDAAVGAVLSQVKEGRECVVAYWSRQLQKAERNYSTIEKEALAIVSAIKEFYPYLYGFHFTLVTDHNPLTTLKGVKDYGGRLTRWMLFLQQFNYDIVYKPGKTHSNADAMSRIPTQDNCIVVVQDVCPLDKLQQEQAKDKQLQPLLVALEKQQPLPNSIAPGLKQAFLFNGVLCRHFGEASKVQTVLPEALKHTVLEHVHDKAGHLGINKTMEKVKERFYWPGYEEDIRSWVRECKQCQQRNPPMPTPQAPLETIQANYPFEKISWDIMGPLPVSNSGNKYVLVVTDLFTKWVEAFPLKETSSATLSNVMVDEIVCRFGVPTSIHSDQGANFCSEVINTMCKLLGIERSQTSAYHPQGNGQVERFNRTMEAMLSKVVQANQKNWDKHLPKVLFAYRTAIHESTKFTPFHLMYGRSPTLPVDVFLGRTNSYEGFSGYPDIIREMHKVLGDSYATVRQNLTQAQSRRKHLHDHSANSTAFQCGDRVWLYVPAVKQGRSRKLSSLWRGPYTVIDKTSSVNYRIQLIGTSQSLVVHHNRLKLCYGDPEPSPSLTRSRRNQVDNEQPASPTSDGSIAIGDSGVASNLSRNQASAVGGYTSSSSSSGIVLHPESTAAASSSSRPPPPTACTRSGRVSHPPARYSDFVPP